MHADDARFRLKSWDDKSVVHVKGWIIGKSDDALGVAEPELAERIYYDEKEPAKLLFCWTKILGKEKKETKKFLKYFREVFDVGREQPAKIKYIPDKEINIYDTEKKVSLILKDTENKVDLIIVNLENKDKTTYEFIVKNILKILSKKRRSFVLELIKRLMKKT